MSRITRFLILGMAMMLATPAFAANEPGEDSRHFGVRANFVLSTSSTITDFTHFGPGTSVGAVYYAPFGRLTYFNTGLLFNYTTIGYKGVIGDKYMHRPVDGHLTMTGLSLPIDIGVKFFDNNKVILSAYTGPHVYFNFKMKAKYDNYTSTGVEEVKKDFLTSGLDLSWGLGIAIDFMRHWYGHVEGVIGLSNMASTSDIKFNEPSYFKRAELSIGVGYNF